MKPVVHWIVRLAYPLEGDWPTFDRQLSKEVPKYRDMASGSDFVNRDVVFDYDTRTLARQALKAAKAFAKMAGRKLLVARIEPCRNPECKEDKDEVT